MGLKRMKALYLQQSELRESAIQALDWWRQTIASIGALTKEVLKLEAKMLRGEQGFLLWLCTCPLRIIRIPAKFVLQWHRPKLVGYKIKDMLGRVTMQEFEFDKWKVECILADGEHMTGEQLRERTGIGEPRLSLILQAITEERKGTTVETKTEPEKESEVVLASERFQKERPPEPESGTDHGTVIKSASGAI